MSKMYYKRIDLIRVFSCVAVLLYHLGILPGGYLAVTTFFVLSGYLTYISASQKDDFSTKEYYLNKLKKLYLPLIIVVFITVFLTSFISDLHWFNLKREVTSIILGYNNFWQINANMDYFSGSINSPFMHLWYISILIQFDLIFPFIYRGLNKIQNKFNKLVPLFLAFLTSYIFTLYFYKMSFSKDIMVVYYSTFTRIFSLLFGLTLGFIHTNYKPLVLNNFKQKVFYLYLLILGCFFINNSSSIYLNDMIIVSIISCRLIDYSISINDDLLFEKIIKFISSISYEIYLVQYPVIFMFKYINVPLKNIVIIAVTIMISYILHLCINNKDKKKNIKILQIIIIILTLLGIIKYITVKSYKKEMKALENQLKQNEINLKENEANYKEQLKKENENWLLTLEELDNDLNKLKDVVTNLPLVGIGDSVMLGAVPNLQRKFPNSYYDARVSRTAWEVNGVLVNLKNNNLLGNPIVINLGTNGDCSRDCKRQIMNDLDGRKVFWVNTVNLLNVNEELKSFKEEYDNLYIIDWYTISRNHPEYFIYDGIHLTETGKNVFADVIYDAVYQNYLQEYQNKKEEIINKHEENLKKKITFYGNDLLLNSFDYLQTNFKDANFMINKDINSENIEENIKNKLNENSFTHNIVLAFDATSKLSKKDYTNIANLFKDYNLYIIMINDEKIEKYSNVTIINLDVKKNDDYLMPDGIHLSDLGNATLSNMITEVLESLATQ